MLFLSCVCVCVGGVVLCRCVCVCDLLIFIRRCAMPVLVGCKFDLMLEASVEEQKHVRHYMDRYR